MIAKSAIAHCGELAPTRSTRSPGVRPKLASALARFAASVAACRQVTGVQVPASFAHRNGLSPKRSAWAKNIVTRFGQVVRFIAASSTRA